MTSAEALTHNLLQFLKSAALPEDMERMRPKSLRFRLFNLAGRIVRHARQATLKLSGEHPYARVFAQAREAIALLALEAPA